MTEMSSFAVVLLEVFSQVLGPCGVVTILCCKHPDIFWAEKEIQKLFDADLGPVAFQQVTCFLLCAANDLQKADPPFPVQETSPYVGLQLVFHCAA